MASGGSGMSNDDIVYELADNILSKLPEVLDIELAYQDMFKVKTILRKTNKMYCLKF